MQEAILNLNVQFPFKKHLPVPGWHAPTLLALELKYNVGVIIFLRIAMVTKVFLRSSQPFHTFSLWKFLETTQNINFIHLEVIVKLANSNFH